MQLSYSLPLSTSSIEVPGSKSLANRLLVLKHLYYPNMEIGNLPASTDTSTLAKLLEQRLHSTSFHFDAYDGGTTFRFLLAVLAATQTKATVTGSARLLKRPHSGLFDSLKQVGCSITQREDNSIAIQPETLDIGDVWNVDVSQSSQYATALALIAPAFGKSIQIKLIGKPVSLGYLDLTISLMKSLGIQIDRTKDAISAHPFTQKDTTIEQQVETDWSAVQYFVSLAVLSNQTITLMGNFLNSTQPDQASLRFGMSLGLDIEMTDEGVRLIPNPNFTKPKHISRNYTNCPDIALSERVCCHALGIQLDASGIDHLQYKESDRWRCIHQELDKFKDQLPSFETHQDHRIAMSLAPLAILKPIIINQPEVVSKSFPDFWEQLNKLGISVRAGK